MFVDVENESDKEIQTNIFVKYETKIEKINKHVDQIIVVMKNCCKVVETRRGSFNSYIHYQMIFEIVS